MKILSKVHQKTNKNPSKSHQYPPTMDQKSFKKPSKIHQKWILEASWGLLGPLGLSGRLPRVPRARPGRVLGRLGGVLVANMAPTWLPKRSQNRIKIEAKIDQNFDASWDRIFEGFWWILEAKWRHVGLQNRILNQALRKCGKSHLELAR